jgi:major vault protein
VEGP